MSRIKNNPLDKADWINETPEEKPKEKKSKSKKGLPTGWTRATFIVEEDLLDKLKNLAYTNRTAIKDEINAALEEYLKDKEIIKRPND